MIVERLTTRVFTDWLEQQMSVKDPDVVVVEGRITDMPDRVVAVRRGSGRGSVMEGLYERSTFIIRSRGGQNDLDDAESISHMVDSIVTNNACNLFYENRHVLATEWTGSGPQQITIEDPQSRFAFECAYDITSAKE